MEVNRRALVVEDNADLARLMRLHLDDIDLQADIAENGRTAIEHYRRRNYDVILLDVMLPEVDGLEVCRYIRAHDPDTPILMLTARSEEIDKVVGLELGADDYLTKPFGVAEFTARVKALLRRATLRTSRDSDPEPIARYGDLTIDCQSREVRQGERLIDLTAREFELLLHFVRHPGKAFTRDELLVQVWGYANGVYQHTVNSHINRLRAKIEVDPANPRYIMTVWGIGYKLNSAVT